MEVIIQLWRRVAPPFVWVSRDIVQLKTKEKTTKHDTKSVTHWYQGFKTLQEDMHDDYQHDIISYTLISRLQDSTRRHAWWLSTWYNLLHTDIEASRLYKKTCMITIMQIQQPPPPSNKATPSAMNKWPYKRVGTVPI